jgi:hypothetical protein
MPLATWFSALTGRRDENVVERIAQQITPDCVRVLLARLPAAGPRCRQAEELGYLRAYAVAVVRAHVEAAAVRRDIVAGAFDRAMTLCLSQAREELARRANECRPLSAAA